ncbi:MAG: organic solvent tolerance protein, partial [Piscirickettsiaceae bacterium]
MIAPSVSFAAGNSAWDCKLADDGETWDCSTSTKSIKKEQPTPNVISKQKKNTTVVISTKKPVTGAATSPARRVRLTTKQPLKQLAKTSTTSASIKDPGNWNCAANANGAWDCSQTQVTILAKSEPKKSAKWDCTTNNLGSWDCNQSSEPSSNQVITSSVNEPTVINNHEISDMLLTQMVAQLSTDPWSTCGAPQIRQQTVSTSAKQVRNNASTDIQADYAELLDQNIAFFSGDVTISRADQQLTADQVTYKNADGFVDASGDVFYQEKGFALHSRQAQLQLNENTGQFNSNHFILEDSHARGTTQTTHIVNKDITRSTRATYSTCKPGETDWQLKAKTLELNNITGRGTARDVWVEFFDIPFLYTPYISFPIDDRRQSGWLAPTFGSSDTTGADFSIPYYWNIAENYDATFTPRIMSNRGFMLGSEFRYLSKISTGQISAEIIEDTDLSKTRGSFSFQDSTRFSKRLTSLVDLNYLSDDDYIDDFGNSLSAASSRYIKSEAELNYRADNWNLLTKIDNYDSIDRNISSSTRPHRRLPQVLFNLRPTDIFGYGKLDMRNEFTYFDHSSRTKGKRLDVHPGISFPFHTPGSFI